MHKIAKKLSLTMVIMNPLALEWMSMASRDLEMKESQVGVSTMQPSAVAEASLDVLHEFLKDFSSY